MQQNVTQLLGKDCGAYDNGTLKTAFQINQSETGNSDVFLPWRNPRNIISYEATVTVIRVIKFYVFPCIFVFGFSTNALNCAVFYRQGLKDRMNLCLFWLAMADLSYLTCLTVGVAEAYIELVDPWFAQEYEVKVHYYMTGVLTALVQTSGCVTAVIAIERCVCVVFPLKTQSLLSTRTTAFILITMTLFLQLAFSTWQLRTEPKQIFDKQSGRSGWVLGTARWGNNEIVFILYYIFFDLLLFVLPLLTMSIVIVCTIITAWRLRMASAWRLTTSTSNVSNVQLQQVALTKALIIISCIFAVCSLPLCILSLTRRIVYEFRYAGYYSNMMLVTHAIGYLVISPVNSSVNFCVYYWRSSRYRLEVHLIFRHKNSPKNQKGTKATKAH